MSKYTTEVRFICEKYAGLDSSVGYADVNKIIDDSWEKIFDFSFPIFDEEYRSVLCKKIIKHYYTREIAFETVGLWKLKLDTLMNEIMPFYNQLYESTLLDFDPLFDADYYKDHKGKDSGVGSETGDRTGRDNSENAHTGTVSDEQDHTGTVTDAGTHGGTIGDQGSRTGERHEVVNDDLSETTWDVYSDTPQGALTNVANETYLTNARKTTHTAGRDVATDTAYSENTSNLRTFNETQGNTRTYNESNDSTRTYNEANEVDRNYSENTSIDREYNNTDEYLDHIYGKVPGRSYMQLIKELRENILNIDVDIIADCGDLFIKLW